MKTLGVLLLLCTSLFAGEVIPRSSTSTVLGASANASGGGTLIQIVQLGTGEPRAFKLHVVSVLSDGAVCSGTFAENGKNVQAGTIFVRGLPANTIDNMWLTATLERVGVETYSPDQRRTKTVASYRVTDAPAAAVPGGQKPWEPKGTALDKKPVR